MKKHCINNLQRGFIAYEVHSDKARLKKLRKVLENQRDGVCIIYANLEEIAWFVYRQINKWHPGEVVMYCGSSRYHEKKPAISKLLGDQYRILVTTCAINKDKKHTDVRLIVHLSMPMSLSEYLRQKEKFCRGKELTKCVLLYSELDFYDNKTRLQLMRDGAESEDRPFDYCAKLSELGAMSSFAYSGGKDDIWA